MPDIGAHSPIPCIKQNQFHNTLITLHWKLHRQQAYMWHRRKNYIDSIKNIANNENTAIAQKAQQFPRISTHLMMTQ
jgi:RNase P subunit RPR2